MMETEPDTTFKKMLKEWGVKLTEEQVQSLALAAADVYAHGTEDGWCCACSADIAFAESTLEAEGWTPPTDWSANTEPKSKLAKSAPKSQKGEKT